MKGRGLVESGNVIRYLKTIFFVRLDFFFLLDIFGYPILFFPSLSVSLFLVCCFDAHTSPTRFTGRRQKGTGFDRWWLYPFDVRFILYTNIQTHRRSTTRNSIMKNVIQSWYTYAKCTATMITLCSFLCVFNLQLFFGLFSPKLRRYCSHASWFGFFFSRSRN